MSDQWVVQEYGYVSLGRRDHQARKARWRLWERTIHDTKEDSITEMRRRIERQFFGLSCYGSALSELGSISRDASGFRRIKIMSCTYEIARIDQATRADNRKFWLYGYDPAIEDCRDMDEYLPPVAEKPSDKKRGWLW